MDLFVQEIMHSHCPRFNKMEANEKNSRGESLGLFARGVCAIIRFVLPVFKIIEYLFIDRNIVRCFSIDVLSKKIDTENQLALNQGNDSRVKIKEIYHNYCEIYRNKSSGCGSCTVRSYFTAQALLTAKQYVYKAELKATLLPVDFEEHFQKGKVQKIKNTTEIGNLSDGTLLIFSQPLTDKTSKFFNKYLLEGSSSQLSHVCNGIVMKGEVYVLEMSKGRFKANPPQSAVIFEKLDDFQKRMDNRGMPRLNLFLPIGKIHPSIYDPLAD